MSICCFKMRTYPVNFIWNPFAFRGLTKPQINILARLSPFRQHAHAHAHALAHATDAAIICLHTSLPCLRLKQTNTHTHTHTWTPAHIAEEAPAEHYLRRSLWPQSVRTHTHTHAPSSQRARVLLWDALTLYIYIISKRVPPLPLRGMRLGRSVCAHCECKLRCVCASIGEGGRKGARSNSAQP